MHSKLSKYAKTHFVMEEATLENCGYPQLEKHIEEHNFFISKIKGTYGGGEGAVGGNLEILGFLSNWYKNHVGTADKEYAPFLHSKGIGKITALADAQQVAPPAKPTPITPVVVSIKWDESYSVGVQSFDDAHKKIFEMINTLHTAMHGGKPLLAMGQILEELWEYTETHFANEEVLMEKYGYPEYKQHKQAHTELVVRLNEIYSRFEQGEPVISMELSGFLVQWLKNHILGVDKRYTAFMKANGVERKMELGNSNDQI